MSLARIRAWNAAHVAACALLLFACATNPVTGRQEIMLTSPEQEAAQGKQAAAQVEREIGLVRDPKFNAYVAAIGQRLAKDSPRKDVTYRFYVADMPEANAFALPGGYIYVSRGLLALANSEDELAGVIGHEIGHVAARHSAQRETRSAGVGILSALGAIAAGVVGGSSAAQAVAQLGQTAGAGMIASYGRDQERQADEIGQQLEARAGWDPEGLADFLTTLDREGQLRSGKQRQPSFLDSHPMPAERAAAARARAPELPRGAKGRITNGHAAFLAKIEGVMVGPNPDEGVFEDEVFLHPKLGFALSFPKGWKTQNTKDAVAAMAPQRDALILLEQQSQSGDPNAAAQRWAQANRIDLASGASMQIGGWPAFRGLAEAQTQKGVIALDVTWIEHPTGTYRITAMTSPSAWRGWEPTFRSVGGSFRPISAAERARARPLRLRVVQAQAGESLEALGRRTGNRWKVAETAVANAIPPDATLTKGQLVKIALPSES